METFKNYLIALLMAIIALLLVTQPAQSAGKSKEAKMIEYARCLELSIGSSVTFDYDLPKCAKYRP